MIFGTTLPTGHWNNSTRNRDGRGEIDRDVAQFRLQTLFKIMYHSVVYGRRVRAQMLAFGVMLDVPREGE